MQIYRKEWFGNIRGDMLSGLVVFMALIPEVMGFCIVAGVDPMVGFYASFFATLMTAIFGGRPGMISAAAGSMALVMAGLIASYGLEYMFAATILTGVIQALFAVLKVGNLMRYLPTPVMVGFVNALGIMMFKSQLSHLFGNKVLIPLALLGVAIIFLFPKITEKIPAPIVAIVAITVIVKFAHADIPMLSDMGNISSQLPLFHLPAIPLTLTTLKIILPYSLSLAVVGMMESLLTAQLVDNMTDSKSNKNKECFGQGIANIASGFMGGMGTCGMIGQTMVNINYGGKGRFSQVVSGGLMLLSALCFPNLISNIPVIALASVMLVVAVTTVDWKALKRLPSLPLSDTIIMVVTVAGVLLTDNLAIGVVCGILIGAIAFAVKSARIHIVEEREDEHTVRYRIEGMLFFLSCAKLQKKIKPISTDTTIKIDFLKSRIMDASAIESIDQLLSELSAQGFEVELENMATPCRELYVKASELSNIPATIKE